MKNIAACNLTEYRKRLEGLIHELRTGSSDLPLDSFVVHQIRLKLCVDLLALHQEFPRYVSVLCYKGKKNGRVLLRIETVDYVKPNEVVDAIDFGYPKFEIVEPKITESESQPKEPPVEPKSEEPKPPETQSTDKEVPPPQSNPEREEAYPGLLKRKPRVEDTRQSSPRGFYGKTHRSEAYRKALIVKIFKDAEPYAKWLPKSYVSRLVGGHNNALPPEMFENNGQKSFQLIKLIDTNCDDSIQVSVSYDKLFRSKGSHYNELFAKITDKDAMIKNCGHATSGITTSVLTGCCFLTELGKFLWEKYQEYKKGLSDGELKPEEKEPEIEPICYNCKHWNNDQNTGDLKRIAADCHIASCRMLTDGTCTEFKAVEVKNVQA